MAILTDLALTVLPTILGATSSPTAITCLLPGIQLDELKRLFFNKTVRRALSDVVPHVAWERDQSAERTIVGEFSKSYKIVLPNITEQAYWDTVLHSNGGTL